ncbi:hypothetical protein EV182_004889, partial [Spiromyces aspiralis]
NRNPSKVIPWITSELFGYLSFNNLKFSDLTVTAHQLGSIIDALDAGTITTPMAKEILRQMVTVNDPRTANKIAEEKGWSVIARDDTLMPLCRSLIKAHPEEVQKFQHGNKRVLGFFVGQAMKATKGQAKPQTLSKLFSSLLSADCVDGTGSPRI